MDSKKIDTLSAQYSPKFFTMIQENARESAKQIVPHVIEFLDPRSVVDVGCGVGTWLKVFQENGVADVLGLDGPWVELESLEISPQDFRVTDLAAGVHAERRFDLVVSLEVAEHLPPASAAGFVEVLTTLGDIVLFSAAVPHQGGVNHTNEQWPDYWAELFQARGYDAADWLRPLIWDKPEVSWWYAQNTLLFVQRTLLASRPELADAVRRTRMSQLALVHPRMHEKSLMYWMDMHRNADLRQKSFRQAVSAVLNVAGATLVRRVHALVK